MKRIKDIKGKTITFIIIFVLIGIGRLLNIPCIFLHITGIECLGCGMTRALSEALQFDFASAFEYHKMFWSLPILGIYILFDGKPFKNRILNYMVIVLIGVGFVINWVLNLLR